MKRIIFLIVLVFSIGFVQAQNKTPLDVNYTEAYPDADLQTLLNALSSEGIPDFQLNILEKTIRERPEGFTGEQTVKILNAIVTSKFKSKAVAILDEHLLGLTSKEIVAILGTMFFPTDKLPVLDALRFFITDEERKYDIVDAFNHPNDKAKAKAILDKQPAPMSFIFGNVKSKNVVFALDLSGSMSTTFTASNGSTFSRLDFVKIELSKALRQLGPTCNFNIILFDTDVKTWNTSMVAATPENIKKALDYVLSLTYAGSTNIYDALEKAFSDKRVNTVYFLTDGTPTSGKKVDQMEILNDLKSWNSGRNVVINTTAFLTGNCEGDNKPMSREFMKQIAVSTKGVYRAIE